MSKKNEELLQTLQRMEDKLKCVSRENAELVGDAHMHTHTHNIYKLLICTWAHYKHYVFLEFSQKEKKMLDSQQAVLKRTSSLTDLSHAHEEQEVEFLRLQVNEQRSVIEELTQVYCTYH